MDIPEQKIESSQSFLVEIHSYPTLERCFTEPPHRIILQGVSDELIEMLSSLTFSFL